MHDASKPRGDSQSNNGFCQKCRFEGRETVAALFRNAAKWPAQGLSWHSPPHFKATQRI
jgi:hypothetical protein